MTKMSKRKYTPQEAYQRQLQRTVEYNRIHKQAAYRNQKKSRAKSFILKDATVSELDEIESYIKVRRAVLKSGEDNDNDQA